MSAWSVVTGGVLAAALAISASGGGDPDLYWHRVLGGTWLEQGSVRLGALDPIAYTPGNRWRPTAWLTEVLYDRIVSAVGYEGVVALRLLVTCAVLALLLRFVYRHLPAVRASLVLALVCIPIAFDFQDRPQTISFLFVALMLPSVHRWLARETLPSLVTVAWFTWIWANVHGLWVLVPLLLSVAALSSRSRDVFWPAARRVGLALIAASVTPVGPELLLIPWRVRSSTAQITEWAPTNFEPPFTWALAASLVLIVIAWSRQRSTVHLREVMYVIAVGAFGMLAFRNVTASTLLLLPPLVRAVGLLAPGVTSRVSLPRVVVLAVSLLLIAVGAASYLREPVIPDQFPQRIGARLATDAGPVRVMNDYNIAGFLREFGGSNVRLAIDGRADRYGARRILDYTNTTQGARGWRRLFEKAEPDVVVIDSNSPLREILVDRGWTTELVDSGFVMLAPPPISQ